MAQNNNWQSRSHIVVIISWSQERNSFNPVTLLYVTMKSRVKNAIN